MSVVTNSVNANSTTPLATVEGGSGVSSPTAHGILVAEGASAFVSKTLTNGQLLTGSTGADPVAAVPTSSASTLTMTTGAGSLNIDVKAPLLVPFGGTGQTTLTTPYGVLAAGTTATDAVQTISPGTSGYVLTSNGSSSLPTFQAAGGGGGGITSINVQNFTSSGTYTPSSGMAYCIVETLGAGGNGGESVATTSTQNNGGGGGGAGGYCKAIFTAATIGANQSVTITSGDALFGTDIILGSTAGANGNPGNNNGFCAAAIGGTWLTSYSNSINVNGQPGYIGQALFSSGGGFYYAIGGFGGSSIYGGGGYSQEINVSGSSNGTPATGYGAGGGGAISGPSSGAFTGGAGSPAIVIITEFIT